ncbi:MAG: four helix bundle protein, partial [Parabacteroides sp.]|nr:four helix bundle protein [Parabacteroides sp.]
LVHQCPEVQLMPPAQICSGRIIFISTSSMKCACSRPGAGAALRMAAFGARIGTTIAPIRTTAWGSASPVTLYKRAIASGKMGVNSEAILNRKYVEFVKLLNIYLNHFPRHEKYALANRIRDTAYEIYDLITEAQKRYLKKTTLTNLDITHEKLRMQLSLANELGYFGFIGGKETKQDQNELARHRYLVISAIVDELGRMIGGWIQKIKDDKHW